MASSLRLLARPPLLVQDELLCLAGLGRDRDGYRSRYLPGEARDARYDQDATRLSEIETVSVPTLMVQGAADYCDEPASSEGLDEYFPGGYRREVIGGVGHFPHREAPELVAESVLAHFRANA